MVWRRGSGWLAMMELRFLLVHPQRRSIGAGDVSADCSQRTSHCQDKRTTSYYDERLGGPLAVACLNIWTRDAHQSVTGRGHMSSLTSRMLGRCVIRRSRTP